MPRPGDVMVPAPQINQGIVAVSQHALQELIELVPAGHVEQVVSRFDRKSQGAPLGEPLYRFQASARAAAAAPSSNALEPLLQIFWGWSSPWTSLLTCLLLCSSSFGVETETVEAPQLQFFDRGVSSYWTMVVMVGVTLLLVLFTSKILDIIS